MIEIWKDIKDYEGLYQVSTMGRVRSLKRNNTGGKILKQCTDKHGYLRVDLSKNSVKNTKRVHRLVAETFIDNDKNLPLINHKDENKKNNKVSNLEFCTCQYNSTYKKINIRKGLIQRKPIVQLKNNIQIKIWDSATSASKELKISRGNIVSTLKGKRPRAGTFEWKYLY